MQSESSCNSENKTKQKNISISTSLLRDCVVLTCCLPALSSTVWSSWEKTNLSSASICALACNCPRGISVHPSLFELHFSATQTSGGVLELKLINMFDAKILTANPDESACLGVWRVHNLLERILCWTSFRQRIHLCINIFYVQTWEIISHGALEEMAEARRVVRREWSHLTCWSLCVINEFVIPPRLAINDLTRRSAVIN